MHHVRVGGVCLLILMIAAALPANVLAQDSGSATSTPSTGDSSAGGAAQTISQSLLSKSTQEESISAEKMAKKSSGLKPLASSKEAGSGSTTDGASAATETPAAADTVAVAETPAAANTVAVAETPAAANTVAATETPAAADTVAATETPAAANTVAATETTSADEATNATTEDVVTPDEIEPGAALASAQENETVASEGENATAEEEDEEEDEEPVDRIWREGISSDDYTWDHRSFSGFFYDMENDVGTEKLNVNFGGSRTIDSGNLVYKTKPENLDFKYGDWGDYQVIGFMAEKYFAGYLASDLIDDGISLLGDNQLRRVLMDDDDSQTLASGSALTLEEDYELQIKQIDIDGEKVYLGLSKDGEEIDSKVVSPEGNLKSSTYVYEVEVSGEDVPIIMAHIASVFASTENDLVTVDGIFQLSDTYASLDDGDVYGKLEVKSVGEDGVEMDNEDSINLKKGGKINLFGEVGFIVADADELRFAPIVERTGRHDVRGTVINPSKVEDFTWNAYNFEGFYYDIDEDVGTEVLRAKITDNKKIDEGSLIYETSSQPVDFEFDSWGKYDVIGFMADKYFAGYNNRTAFTDEVSVISEGQLRKVLVDDDKSQTIASGSVLALEEGYELQIKSVDLNGNKVYLALVQNGDEVDSKVVTPSSDPEDKGSNYLYKVDIGSEEVPIVAAHIVNVFRSTESDLATVDGLFQVSDSPESVEEGEVHGKMKVESLGDDSISMENDGSFSLARDKTIEIMENLRFVIADSDERLMAPVATKDDGGMNINITAPDAVVSTSVTISARSDGDPLAGVQIVLNGSSIGTTSATGSITYTPTSTGTFQLVGKKKDYSDGKASLVVRTASEAAQKQGNETDSKKLSINAPGEVFKGENFLITVFSGANRTPVEDAQLSLDGDEIGSTGSQGRFTYSANLTGEFKLKAEKEGLDSASQKINFVSPLNVADLTLPEVAYAGSEMKVVASVENEGSIEDTRMFEMKANDSVVDSKNVTVKGGENSTISFSYKPKEPGLASISVDDVSETIKVEEAKSNTWVVILIVVLLIAIGGGYYLYSTGELDGLQRQIKKMMQGR